MVGAPRPPRSPVRRSSPPRGWRPIRPSLGTARSSGVVHAGSRIACQGGTIVETRIRDGSLAERWAAGLGPWTQVSRPVLHQVGRRVSTLDLTGRTIACFQHVAADTPLVLVPLVQAGACVSIAAVNP